MRAPLRTCAVALTLLTGCAELPPTPAPTAPAPTVRPRAEQENSLAPTIAAHRQRALQERAGGDLANAEIQWHVLTLLAPDTVEFREQLTATRAAIAQVAAENLQAGHAAVRAGETERASVAFLRVLAVDPENAEAARGLREIEKRKLARIQADRAAKVRQDDARAAAKAPRAAPVEAGNGNGYDLEQRLEMLNAGDTAGGLRELRAYVAANPQDRTGRLKIGAAVFDRAREIESQGGREQALPLYEAAIALRGEAPAAWPTHVQTLRKALSAEYYDRGTLTVRTDLPAAIKALETSLRYDPGNAKASARLAEAKHAQSRLKAIDKAPAPKK
ncbi:MAG: hypothetical protein ABJC33_05065 [Betaproteobacteria bacterium]